MITITLSIFQTIKVFFILILTGCLAWKHGFNKGYDYAIKIFENEI